MSYNNSMTSEDHTALKIVLEDMLDNLHDMLHLKKDDVKEDIVISEYCIFVDQVDCAFIVFLT